MSEKKSKLLTPNTTIAVVSELVSNLSSEEIERIEKYASEHYSEVVRFICDGKEPTEIVKYFLEISKKKKSE